MRRAQVMFLAFAACKPENQIVEIEYRDPVLELEYPAPAEWTVSGSIEARGRAENLDSVAVSGREATVTDGRFVADVALDRGVNLVEASGLDMRGDTRFVRNGVLAGEFKQPAGMVANAGQIRVNQGGLDAILDAIAPMLDVYAVAPLISNPVYADSYEVEVLGYGFELLYVEAYITEIWWDAPVLSMDPKDGHLDLHGELPNLYAQVYVWADVAGLWEVDGYADVEASQVVLDVPVTVGAPNHRLTVGMDSPSTRIDDFWFDLSLIPSEIEGLLLSDVVEVYLEDAIPGMMVEMIPPLLQEQLDALDPSFETELMGKSLAIEAQFTDAGVDEDGIVVDLDIDVDMPGSADFPYEGYLTGDSFDEGHAPSRSDDLSMSLYDDLLNRVMFEAWSAELLELRLSSEDGSLSPIMLAPLHATEGTIAVSGHLPPVVVKNKDGEFEAQIAELDVVIDTPDGELGHHLVASVTAYVPLEVKVTAGVLKLELGEPELYITVRDSDWGASDETVTQLLEEMLPINSLLAIVGDFEFPLPALPGISIVAGDAERRGEVHTNATVDLQ